MSSGSPAGDAAAAAAVQVAGLRGVTKTYPGVRALDNVSLDLHAGETVGLVGKNGAGKSTLIKILAGLVQPDSGEVLSGGHPVRLDGPAAAGHEGLAFVHQELSLVPNLSVAENISLGLGFPKVAGLVDRTGLRRRARDVLARLGAAIDPAVTVSRLPLAQQRLVMLARGLAQDARLVVLDEPTASMSDSEIGHLFTVMDELRRDGVGLVYVSHRLDEVTRVTDRVVVMRDGAVVAEAATRNVDRDWLVSRITGQEGHAGDAAARRASRSRRAAGAELLTVEHVDKPGVLSDVSFGVCAGEVVGLAGLVGSGRTELVHVVFGADRARSGRVLVAGRPVPLGSPRAAMRRGIVLLPEDRRGQGNILGFGIRGNVTLSSLPAHRRLRRVPVPSAGRERASAVAMVDRLSIRSTGVEQPVAALSGGNQQKVVLARWLCHGAEVFLFDEPTHGVDVGGKQEIYRIIEELADAGKAVLFISSEFSELVEVCDRVLVLREGRLAGELADDAVTEAAILQRCYA